MFLPRMIELGRGSIIHMASTTGVTGVLDRLAYGVSKHAVVGLTKSMALDHAKTGVRVNCICPGRVETPFMLARIQEYPDPAAAYREMSDTQAIGRMGRPEEVAEVALFLAGDASSFMTGSAVVVDGGWTAGRS
jgi:NAD(P)-dependent dehydrogenase (short-subunit alcohol dehydrogenase family)